MKKVMYIFGLLLLFWGSRLSGQDFPVRPGNDNPVSSPGAPAIDRPLLIKKGILRATSGYAFSSADRFYADRQQVSIFQDNTARTMQEHVAGINLSFGLTDWLGISLALPYRRQTEIFPSVVINSLKGTSELNISYLTSGLSDATLLLGFRLPVEIERFDHVIEAGIVTPLSDQDHARPLHMIEYAQPGDPTSTFSAEFTCYPPAGQPAVSLSAGGMARYRFGKYAGWLRLRTNVPLQRSDRIAYSFRAGPEGIEYREISFRIRPGIALEFQPAIHYQPFPRLAVHGGYLLKSERRGTFHMKDNTWQIPATVLQQMVVGYEFQLTRNLRIVQEMHLPLSGSNTYKRFEVSAGLVLSIIPIPF